jgi:integrase
MLRWAKARGYIKLTGFDAKTMHFGKDPQRERTLKDGEETALVAACQRMNNKWHKFVGPLMEGRLYCALDTAIRQGTMLKLQNKHIDFEDWVLHIPAAIAKDDEDLDVPVESTRLRSFLKKRRILGPEAYPFGHHDGTYQGDIKKAMKSLFKLAGITFGRDDMVWHDLRHDTATMLVAELGTPLSVAKEITGHAHASMLERYVNPKLEQKRAALKALAEAREKKLRAEAKPSKGRAAKAS